MAPGETIDVDRLKVQQGDTVVLDRVLVLGDGTKVTLGSPLIAGARVIATLKSEERTRKTIVFKYKAKTRYHRKNGHRQTFSRLTIDKILEPGSEETEPGKAGEPDKEVKESGS